MRVTLRSVVVEMTDDEQSPAGCHPGRDAFVEVQLRHGRVCIVGSDQVELRFRFPDGEVRLHPRDTALHPGSNGTIFGIAKRRLGDIGPGDVPALLRQPDRFCSGTTANVDRGSWSEFIGLVDQMGVRIARAHRWGSFAAPGLIPIVLVE